ncbi:MAG: hypothetical protein V3V22_03965 [Methylococcales bacterium]
MTEPSPQIDPSSLNQIQHLIQKILPLVDDVADALGLFLLLSLIVISWIFVYLFWLNNYSIMLSLSISACALIPCLILTRIWFALENLKDIPNIVGELSGDVSESANESWQAVKSGKKGTFNIIGQARKLFQIRSLLSSGKEVFTQYFSIGPLINPFYIIFGVISLISLFFMLIVGIVLGIISLI